MYPGRRTLFEASSRRAPLTVSPSLTFISAAGWKLVQSRQKENLLNEVRYHRLARPKSSKTRQRPEVLVVLRRDNSHNRHFYLVVLTSYRLPGLLVSFVVSIVPSPFLSVNPASGYWQTRIPPSSSGRRSRCLPLARHVAMLCFNGSPYLSHLFIGISTIGGGPLFPISCGCAMLRMVMFLFIFLFF